MRRFSVVAAMGLAGVSSTALAAPDSPVGIWMTGEKDSRIRVSPCGKALCASVVWTRESGTDSNNPNPALRERNIVGIELTRDMKPDNGGGWAGSMYNPEDGKTYRATMRRKGERQLEVGGCVLGGLICGSETWQRQGEDTAAITRP